MALKRVLLVVMRRVLLADEESRFCKTKMFLKIGANSTNYLISLKL